MPKLTKRLINARTTDPEREQFVWDSELRGFGIRIKPSGAKAWLIQYRNIHRQTRRMVIGKVGTLTPHEARELARDALASVAKGCDPSSERHKTKDAVTVSALCDWYLREARKGALLGKSGHRIKDSTLDMDESRIETHVKPLTGKRVVATLTLDDFEKMQAAIAAGRTTKARSGRGGAASGGAAVAGRTVGMLHAIFAHGVRRRLIASNPATGVRKSASKRRSRRLSLEEISALGRAMREAAATGENSTGLRAIRAMLLTGLRRMEVLTLRTASIGQTPRGGFVTLSDTKTGPQVRPIGQRALALLQSAAGNSEWIFPADRGNGHFVGVVKVLNRVCKRAGLSKISPHILRHSFASIAGDLGFSKLTIAGLLGHSQRGSTESYVHLDIALLAAAEGVSAHIANILDGVAKADIIPLREIGSKTVQNAS
jgi:integrase